MSAVHFRQNLHFLSPDRQSTIFIGGIVESATILDKDNTIKKVGKDYFEFGYDYSILHTKPVVVLDATFSLKPARHENIARQIQDNLAWRNDKQPQLSDVPSCGSVFKKIENLGAGRLIEKAGLKGTRVGGAMISPKHANYIVNMGGATAKDVLALIAHVQTTVLEKTGNQLEPEISFVGDFE